MNEIHPAPADWRNAYAQSRPLAMLELLLLGAVTSIQFLGFGIQISPTLMVLGWLSLMLRRVGWRGIGMGRPAMGWPRTIGWGLLAGLVAGALSNWVFDPLVAMITSHPPDLSSFRPMIGNWRLLLVALTLSWTFAAFGEEIINRAYLCNRLTDIFGQRLDGKIIAVILSSILFGSLHSYQGTSGMLSTGLGGVMQCLAYYLSGRNLWVSIIMHGTLDTIGFALIYSGTMPGL